MEQEQITPPNTPDDNHSWWSH